MQKGHSRGFTLVELLIVAGLVTLVFGGLLGSLQSVMKLISHTKISTSALSLANERMEYIRSLEYDAVGTVDGIPNGSIPQNATTTLNGITFHERILIQYVDAPEDGSGASDENGILADYKEVKVEYSWADPNGTSSVFLLTNIVPPGIETTAGGGTLIVNVYDADVSPILGAEVHVYNDTGTSTVDVTRYTNIDGVAMFAGAPAGANYEITVTKDGYSTESTHTPTVGNPDPITRPVAVAENVVSTVNFQIDILSDVTIRTVGPSTDDTFGEPIDSLASTSASDSVTVSGGVLTLSGVPGAYAATGTVLFNPVEPTPITSWDTLSWNASTPTDTALRVRVYDDASVLIPDTDLPGNSAGFDVSPVSLSTLDVGTYPSLAVHATLTTLDANVTPELLDWELAYAATEPAIGNVSFTLTGDKMIGINVPKYEEAVSTDSTGELVLTDMDWGVYTANMDASGYDIAEACPGMPYTLEPDREETLTLTLVPTEDHTLRAVVLDMDGDPIPGAEVEVSRPGLNESGVTSGCGQVFFNTDIVAALDYTIDVSATGYVGQTVTDYEINGDDVFAVTLIES